MGKGFSQREGIDFGEIFSHVVKQTSIRTILAIVTQLDMEMNQMHVKMAFLNGELQETIYMK